MPKKIKEAEVEIDVNVNKPQGQSTYATRWFNDYAVDNKSEMKIICDMTARSAEEQFNMYLTKGNTEVFACVFHGTFLSILEFIASKQKHYNKFTLEVANSVNIGYENNENEDNEKVGNFMPIIEHIGINRNLVDDDISKETQISHNFIRWNQLNIKKNIELFKEIQEIAYNKLKTSYAVNIRTSEGIIPLFCVFFDNIVNVLKMKYKEAESTDVSEVSLNVFSLFHIFYSFNEEDNLEIVEFKPEPAMKLALKSDTHAGKED